MSNWLFPDREVEPADVDPSEVAVDPLDPSAVDPGTSVLVVGPAMTGKRRLGLDLVSGSRSRAACLVSTKQRAPRVYRAFEAAVTDAEGWDCTIINCNRSSDRDRDGAGYALKTVSTPGDLTGVGIHLSGLLQRWDHAGVTDPRLQMHTLSTMLMYADLRRVFQFLHAMTTRLAKVDAVSAFTLDTTSRHSDTVSRLAHLFDALVEVRENDDGRELRVRGGQFGPSSWTQY